MSPIVGRSCRPVQHQVEPGCTRFGEHQRRATLTPQTDSAAGTTFLRNNNWDSDLSEVDPSASSALVNGVDTAGATNPIDGLPFSPEFLLRFIYEGELSLMQL